MRHKPTRDAGHAAMLARTWRNLGWALAVIGVALAAGMLGYGLLGPMGPVEAFANAAMILSGMGPLKQLTSTRGLIFEGAYALVCGFLFFATAGFVLAPALHLLLRRFHLEDEAKRDKDE